MGREVDIPWEGGSKYHGLWVRYTMRMGDQNTMSKGVKMPWVEFQLSIYCYIAIQN
jgi:hypothetical protein